MRKRKINFDKSDGLHGVLFRPESGWRPPASFPCLDAENVIGLDIESRDPDISKRGPGFIRGDAEVVGISVSASSGSWYFPIAHLGGGNMDRSAVLQFIRDLLSREDLWIIGANVMYELEGIELGLDTPIRGKLIDVQLAEALIDEESVRGYSLEALCQKYLGGSKDEKLLDEASRAYGFENSKACLWKLPSEYVGPYAEYDSFAPIQIFKKQKVILEEQNLLPIFELESKLTRVLWKMRRRGIPVDLDAAEKLNEELKIREKNVRQRFFLKEGYYIDEWSGPQLAKLFTKHKLHFPTTDKGNASFEGEFLEHVDHPAVRIVRELRHISRMRGTFVEKWMLENHVNGRIHCEWKQCASDDGGTRTGRMAASNPNPQQVPAGKFRTTGKPNPIGKAIRACIISDTGLFGKYDYKQQEPRILTHFANLCKMTGAAEAAEAYRKNKEMDFYQYMVTLAGIDRRPAKDLYLGRSYGMGKKKLAMKLNRPIEEAEKILEVFDQNLPFIKEIADSCDQSAQNRGYIKTLLGRRRHFEWWEPWNSWKRRQEGEKIEPRRVDEARQMWPGTRLVRTDTRKALNALIQGSAADMIKAAMVQLDEVGTLPYMTIHDEIDCPINDERHAKEVLEVMEHCVEMTVPVYCDMDLGKGWK